MGWWLVIPAEMVTHSFGSQQLLDVALRLLPTRPAGTHSLQSS